MHFLSKLVREIHRRSVWQVMAGYLAGSWLLLRVVALLADAMGLPGWTQAFALALLAIGVPIVTATAVIQEGVAGLFRVVVDPSEMDLRTPSDVHVVPPARGLSRVFTWRNAVLGGVGAGTLFVASVLAYGAMLVTGFGSPSSLISRGLIEEGAPILLTEIESPGDSILAATVTEALRASLHGSAVVTLVNDGRAADLLQQLGDDGSVVPTAAVAVRVAALEGAGAALTGSVSREQGRLRLVVRVLSASGGRRLATLRETAAAEDALLDAVHRLSRRLRQRVGEPLPDTAMVDALSWSTTDSQEAFGRLALSRRAELAGDLPRAVRLLQEALAVDSTFSLAHARLRALTGNDP